MKARRILLVEDEKTTADALQLLLQNLGYRVTVAYNGKQAIECGKALKPQVVICDIDLQGELDGYTVGSSLRAAPGLESTLLIAMTGFNTARDRERALSAGFNCYLLKPISIHHLTQLLAEFRVAH